MEVWRSVKNYEGFYEVSNYGNIRSVDRYIVGKRNKTYTLKGRIKKKSIGGNGYHIVTLSKNGLDKQMLVHRLVASAFIENKNNLPVINHKDEDKLNNHVDNLEWCTYTHNNRYGSVREKTRATIKKLGHMVPVNKYDINGNFICKYESLSEAKRETGVHIQNISIAIKGYEVVNGKRVNVSHAGGYKWEYA